MAPLFGFYRWVLACMVAYSHTGKFHHLCGAFSVFAFFILSGFLITMILRRRYGHSARGLCAYAANRFLRIFPLYWLAIGMAWLVASEVGRLTLWKEIQLPQSGTEWVGNIFLFTFAEGKGLLSVAWSLRTELWLYLLLPLVVLNRAAFFAWVAASACLLVWFMSGEVAFADRYFTVYGASPAFAAGALIYHFHNRLPRLPALLGFTLMGLALALVFVPGLLPDPMGKGFYAVMACHAGIVVFLSRQQVDKASALYRADAFAGKLAYPIFLFHLPVAEVARLFIPAAIHSYSLPFYLLSLAAVHAVALAVHMAVERPVNVLRARLRP